MGSSVRPKRQELFLQAYAACGNVSRAAAEAGIVRRTHYNWLENDHEYAEAFRHAAEEAADKLEAEAWRRAVEGQERPVYQGGKLAGMTRDYSDALLIFLLKGARPDKYMERHVNIAVAGSDAALAAIRASIAAAVPAVIEGTAREALPERPEQSGQ